MRRPYLSIVIPVYNPNLSHLKDALESACLIREFAPRGAVEVVVADDATPDIGTQISTVCREFEVSYHRNARNLGMVGNWNDAISRSTGEIVICLGQDDILQSSIYSFVTSHFHRDSDLKLLGWTRTFIDSDGTEITHHDKFFERNNVYRKHSTYRVDASTLVYLSLTWGNFFGEPSCFAFKRHVFDEVGGFSRNYRHSADVEFYLRIATKGYNLLYVAEPQSCRRIHPNNLTKENKIRGFVDADRLALYRDFHVNISPTDQQEVAAMLLLRTAVALVRSRLTFRRRTSSELDAGIWVVLGRTSLMVILKLCWRILILKSIDLSKVESMRVTL